MPSSGYRPGTANDGEVLVELKAGVVYPDRSTETDGHVDQPLPQPGNRGQALL